MREIRVLSQGWEDPLGEGYGNPLQDSCLENSTDKGAWQGTVHGDIKSGTQLKCLSTHARTRSGFTLYSF